VRNHRLLLLLAALTITAVTAMATESMSNSVDLADHSRVLAEVLLIK
jgi:hypothetical protein